MTQKTNDNPRAVRSHDVAIDKEYIHLKTKQGISLTLIKGWAKTFFHKKHCINKNKS